VTYLGDTTNRTVTWSEDGDKTVLASRTGLNNPGIGNFYYGPDAIFSNFDVRFDDIIVRQTSGNEPTATIGNLETLNSTTVKIDGLDCTNVVVASNGNSLTCNTPAHATGKVPVTVYNGDGQNYVFYSYEYTQSNNSPSSQTSSQSVSYLPRPKPVVPWSTNQTASSSTSSASTSKNFQNKSSEFSNIKEVESRPSTKESVEFFKGAFGIVEINGDY
jgi:hypothetical protein